MESTEIEFLDSSLAEEVLHIHYSAVHEGRAPRFYPERILNEWSPPITQKRIDEFGNKMKGDGAQGVIVTVGGNAVGFGILVSSESTVGAVYVKAPYTGRGIGGLILKKIEEMAVSSGCSKLFLDASLNAYEFYKDHGYQTLEKTFHELPSGVMMKCVKMGKSLGKELS